MRKFNFRHLLFTFALIVSFMVSGQTNGSKPRHYMAVTVDVIDNQNSDGVSRVGCTLIGVPHTSSRVDSVTAIVKGKNVKASDIDGVDFNRYFQWEESGIIQVEVDLPKNAVYEKNDSIKFHTVHGTYVTSLKR